jgi:hypothetical protein
MSVERIGNRPKQRFSAPARATVSLWLEAILWCFALGWIFFLAWDFKRTYSLRSAGEFVLIGLLVWWPMIRHRIKYGEWT